MAIIQYKKSNVPLSIRSSRATNTDFTNNQRQNEMNTRRHTCGPSVRKFDDVGRRLSGDKRRILRAEARAKVE